MKTKKFQDLLQERLSKEEIADIKRQAKAEVDALRKMQNTTIAPSFDTFYPRGQKLPAVAKAMAGRQDERVGNIYF